MRFPRRGNLRAADRRFGSSATADSTQAAELLLDDARALGLRSFGADADRDLAAGSALLVKESSGEAGGPPRRLDASQMTELARLGFALRHVETERLEAARDHDHAGWFTLLQAVEGYSQAGARTRADDWLARCCHGLVNAGEGLWTGFASLIPGAPAEVRNAVFARGVARIGPRSARGAGASDPQLVRACRWGFLYRCSIEVIASGQADVGDRLPAAAASLPGATALAATQPGDRPDL